MKTKWKIDDAYNFNDKDKLFMIYNDLDLEKRHTEYKNNSKNDIS